MNDEQQKRARDIATALKSIKEQLRHEGGLLYDLADEVRGQKKSRRAEELEWACDATDEACGEILEALDHIRSVFASLPSAPTQPVPV